MTHNKPKPLKALVQIAQKLKSQNKKIVTTNGVFDILHIGHVRYLRQAKKLGDILIVGINSNSSVKRLKGKNRPINNEKDRAEVLSALECVDYILIFSEDNPIQWLSQIKPDIHVKGGDYKTHPEKIIEKEIVEKNNGKIIILDKVQGVSTTETIEKILSQK